MSESTERHKVHYDRPLTVATFVTDFASESTERHKVH